MLKKYFYFSRLIDSFVISFTISLIIISLVNLYFLELSLRTNLLVLLIYCARSFSYKISHCYFQKILQSVWAFYVKYLKENLLETFSIHISYDKYRTK